MNRTFVIWGSIFGFLSVALGAFGAHALKAVLSPELLANFQTGVQYQMMHALGLIGVGLASLGLGQRRALTVAGWSMLIGIVIFSGSLYALSLSGVKMLGAITPIGGVAFLIGWLSLTAAAWKK
ncbi:Uncharacterized membrane protein YgdD, TMEM256/DUF423 family [Paenibacillus sp. UNCCL117]|uniref:DUF423 domain-containing protein n=1 Tax=unclassified Paenibacillus TaxID=185978 RepID=UPI0008923CCD|nr:MULTISPECIES: DUF423 domain-containing protein [unclassified Paenibacillus]SDC06143.1 Uncharacterized membrane protein YgdD, TMEM256/DUF423 family [Paenibacillus sp. cl123]SFW37745.1 Uncharacterized membrane protein YgdD, TMEM256/DUF423 family [Paenibacillus sp. UNCCL117]